MIHSCDTAGTHTRLGEGTTELLLLKKPQYGGSALIDRCQDNHRPIRHNVCLTEEYKLAHCGVGFAEFPMA